ncbi:MAG: hypothetical protein ACOCR1_04985 [Planctomycetota bacterium]
MSKLEKKLKEDRSRFNRRLVRIGILMLAALILGAVVLVYMVRTSGLGEEYEGPDRRAREDHLDQPTAVPTADPDDPSQVVLPGFLTPERHANPTRSTPAGKMTLVDKDILATVLESVMEIPQEELEARVDGDIEWEDFNDKIRREEIRGRVAQFRGTLRRFTEAKGVEFPDIGVDTLYEGQIQDVYGRWYSFYCFEKPEEEIERTDLAILTGVFYKLIRYNTRGGEQMISPLIVARTVTSRQDYRSPQSGTQDGAGGLPGWVPYAVLTVIAIGLCIMFHFWFRKKPTRYNRRNRL